MADAYEHGEDASHPEKASFAANRNFIAIGRQYGVDVFVRGAESSEPPFRLADGLRTFAQKPIIALSHVQLRHLAVSFREAVVVYDVHRRCAIATLRGHGRAVSSIAWSAHDGEVIAIGCVDGHIAVFDVESPLRATLSILGTEGVCRHLAWSPVSSGILVACSGDKCVLWRIDSRSYAEVCRWEPDGRVRQLLWRSSHIGHLLMLEESRVVAILDLTQFIDQAPDSTRTEATDELFGRMDDIADSTAPRVIIRLLPSARYAAWIGERGLLLLCKAGLQLYSVQQDGLASCKLIWRVSVAPSTQHFAVAMKSDTVHVDLYPGATVRLSFPTTVTETLGLDIAPKVSSTVQTTRLAEPETIAGDSAGAKTNGMRPVSITSLRARRALDDRSVSNKTQTRSSKSASTLDSRPASAKSDVTALTALQTTPPRSREVRSLKGSGSATSSPARPHSSPDSQAMTSSLELPGGDENDSPMPFLSPAIPGRRPSPLLLRNDDSTTLVKPTNEARSLPLRSADDSDSDEETLDSRHGRLKSSDANAPSLRTCGASFTKDGDILCYFPSRQIVAESPNPSLPTRVRHYTPSRSLRLFPSFGNFAYATVYDSDSDSDESMRFSEVASIDIPHIELQPPSFHKLDFMKGRNTSMNTKADSTYTLQRSRMSQRRLDGARELGLVGTDYRFDCIGTETLTEVCDANAQIATMADSHGSVMIWRVLSKLLTGPTQSSTDLSQVTQMKIAIPASRLLRTDSGVQLSRSLPATAARTSLHWLDDIAASAWLIDDIMHLGERQADMPLLACVSSILLTAQVRMKQSQRAVDKISSRTTMRGKAVALDSPKNRTLASASETAIPVFRSSAATSIETRPSPKKRLSSSQNSSRATSGPTTPFSEPSSITPPFPFPTIGRNNSRVSASGSASPEHHRSSFSATAKAYAQSISEKFSSYGTSPPMKKGSGSPGNELSSAMTPGGGSWTKSVSFASTTSTARGSIKSQQLASDGREDEYDSDRTIDDTSYPPTPKSTGGAIVLKAKNVGAFADDVSGAAAGSSLSPSMTTKARVWTRHYAEHLRRDERFVEAAEMDKLAQDDHPLAAHDGISIFPEAQAKRPNCRICTCQIDGLQQVCGSCLHATHLQCLQTHIQALDGEVFECPSGCGCACQGVPFIDAVWEDSDPTVETSVARRKWSLTDPRIWRARMEGESW
ncbi:hypothetical protein LTR95_011613 [Oleoguttula sp. CCFEE 5521]